jgi:cytidyltransferase-like protein
MTRLRDKFTTFEALAGFRELDPDAERIVVKLGTFDVLHVGHVDGLEFARELGTLLVVGVWPDQSVREWKGMGRPLNDADRRMRMLANQQQVGYVFEVPRARLRPDLPVSREAGALAVMAQLEPDVLVRGGEASVAAGTYWTKDGKGMLVIDDPTYANKDTSTTEIVGRMNGHRADFGFPVSASPLVYAQPAIPGISGGAVLGSGPAGYTG